MRTSRALLIAAGIASGAATPVGAQRSHIGFHIGYSFDLDEALAGAQLHLPLGRGVELYPSFDYYFENVNSLIGFNVDLKIHGTRRNPFYVGGGLNFLRASGGDTETGVNLFGGVEPRYGLTHPYVELRLLLQNEATLLLLAGLNFTLF